MKRTWNQLIACSLAVCILITSPILSSQTRLSSSPPAPGGDPWPREITVPGAILQMFMLLWGSRPLFSDRTDYAGCYGSTRHPGLITRLVH